MSDRRVPFSLSIALALAAPAVAQAPDGQAILAEVDRVRNPVASFAVDDVVTEYKNGKAVSQASFIVRSKLDNRTMQYRNLIGYVEPKRDQGKLLLMNGATMWFYDPNSRQSIRISPQQRLIGSASNADVLSTNMARDYRAGSVTSETVKDADQVARPSWRLVLTPSGPQAAYGRIEFWVDRKTNVPIKGRFYADSSRLLKTVFYADFKSSMGGLRPSKAVIVDQLDATHVTTMRFLNFRASDAPDEQFQREYLPRIKVR